VSWTLLHAPSSRPDDVRAAIRAGRLIGVRGAGGQAQLAFVSQRMVGDTLEVRVRGPVGGVAFTAQDGLPRTAVVTVAHGVTTARAVARPTDGYVRATVSGTGAADGELLLLNPVIRWDGQLLGAGSATVNAPRTVALRWFACCLYAAAFTSMHVRRRRRVPSARPVQV
jgi:hypothetical protein